MLQTAKYSDNFEIQQIEQKQSYQIADVAVTSYAVSSTLRESSTRIDCLPIDILIKILEYADELRYANRRLYSISEKLDSHKLLKYVSNFLERRLLHEIVESETISKYLAEFSYSVTNYNDGKRICNGVSSHRTLAAFLRRDYCFFTPEHIVTGNPAMEIEHIHTPVGTDQQDLKALTSGTWKHVTGALYASAHTCIHASNVHWLNIQYRTRLAPGRYDVRLRIRASPQATLVPIRFKILENAFVKQNFTSFCPPGWDVGGQGWLYPYDLLLGEIVVLDPGRTYPHDFSRDSIGNAWYPGFWPEVHFQIEDLGNTCRRGLLFEYLSFVVKPSTSVSAHSIDAPPEMWKISIDPLSIYLTPELRKAYEEYNRLKTVLLPMDWKVNTPLQDAVEDPELGRVHINDSFRMPRQITMDSVSAEAQALRDEAEAIEEALRMARLHSPLTAAPTHTTNPA